MIITTAQLCESCIVTQLQAHTSGRRPLTVSDKEVISIKLKNALKNGKKE